MIRRSDSAQAEDENASCHYRPDPANDDVSVRDIPVDSGVPSALPPALQTGCVSGRTLVRRRRRSAVLAGEADSAEIDSYFRSPLVVVRKRGSGWLIGRGGS